MSVSGEFQRARSAEKEILTLRAQLAEQRERSQTLIAESTRVIDPSKLAQGEDKIEFPLRIYSGYWNDNTDEWVWSTVTWNDVLAAIGPSLIDEATEEEVESKFKLCLFQGEISAEDRAMIRKVTNLKTSVPSSNLVRESEFRATRTSFCDLPPSVRRSLSP